MKRRASKASSAIFILFFLISLAFASEVTDRVDKLFVEWSKPDSPGCALGIIKDGQFIYRRGYGMANLEYNMPITSKTVFRIGSTSKQFTAVCILLLEEEGKLSLDDDIRKYLPQIPDYGIPMTIRHLLHHTSGIRDYLTLMSLAGARDDDFYVDGEVVDLLARQRELNFNPGNEHLYSNSGYFLLSVIAKKITGKSMSAYAQENIFKPLNMNHTHFHDDHTMIVKNRASGYSLLKERGFRIDMTTLDMIGDGGIFTCVDDLLHWDRNFYSNRLGKGRKELIHKIQTPGVLKEGKTIDYALGLVVSHYKGLKMISHGGAFVGFRAEMIRFPEQRFSVIVLANLSTINPSQLARRVADIYLADQLKKEDQIAPLGKPQFIKLPPSELKSKVGAYYNEKTDRVWKLSLKEGRLLIDTGTMRFFISPLDRSRFIAVESPVEMVIEFKETSPTTPLKMRVQQEEREPQTFESIQLVSPTRSQLKEYVGTYYSQELHVAYTVVVKENKLFLHHQNPYKGHPHQALEPTIEDRFLLFDNHLKFLRDEKGEVYAFTMNAGRVRNIRFVKEAS